MLSSRDVSQLRYTMQKRQKAHKNIQTRHNVIMAKLAHLYKRKWELRLLTILNRRHQSFLPHPASLPGWVFALKFNETSLADKLILTFQGKGNGKERMSLRLKQAGNLVKNFLRTYLYPHLRSLLQKQCPYLLQISRI